LGTSCNSHTQGPEDRGKAFPFNTLINKKMKFFLERQNCARFKLSVSLSSGPSKPLPAMSPSIPQEAWPTSVQGATLDWKAGLALVTGICLALFSLHVWRRMAQEVGCPGLSKITVEQRQGRTGLLPRDQPRSDGPNAKRAPYKARNERRW
jgi:hypothetical protein